MERLHNTITEHTNLLEQSKGFGGSEAVILAGLVYSSIHSTTQVTPFDIIQNCKCWKCSIWHSSAHRLDTVKLGGKIYYLLNLRARKILLLNFFFHFNKFILAPVLPMPLEEDTIIKAHLGRPQHQEREKLRPI